MSRADSGGKVSTDLDPPRRWIIVIPERLIPMGGHIGVVNRDGTPWCNLIPGLLNLFWRRTLLVRFLRQPNPGSPNPPLKFPIPVDWQTT